MKKYFFCMSLVLSACAHADDPINKQREISVHKLSAHIDNSLLRSVPLDNDESISLENSLIIKTPNIEYYFLAIEDKQDQTCKLDFLNAENKRIISNGDFFFDKCKFIHPPEVLDINLDGITDFRVWINIPHQLGSRVKVDHNLDFIYKKESEMFCENDTSIPCNKASE